MFLLADIVLGFILFMIVYGRYMNACGHLTDRRIKVENYRGQLEQRINKINDDTEKIDSEIELAKQQLKELESNIIQTRLK